MEIFWEVVKINNRISLKRLQNIKTIIIETLLFLEQHV